MKQNVLIGAIIENLYRIIHEGAYSSIIPSSFHRRDFLPSERAYAMRISYGVLEQYLLLEHYLNELAKKRVNKKLKLLLLSAIYEMEFMQENADHISVNAYVNYTKEVFPYAKNFVNAILREHLRRGRGRFQPLSFEDWAKYYSHPMDLAEHFRRSYGEEKALELMRQNQNRAKLNLRVNLTKTSPEELLMRLHQEGVRAMLNPYSSRCLTVEAMHEASIRDLKAYQEGLFYVQDLSSILLVDALHIRGDEKVLDLCSAPGGKALAIAEEMQRSLGTGEITSCDIFDAKLNMIRENADRLGIERLNILKNDASKVNPAFVSAFDLVLADLPCSGLGIIRKKIEIKYKKLGENLESMIKLQSEILRICAAYAKVQGRLVYSTCTMNPRENERQVELFLAEHKNFVLDRIETAKISASSYLQLFTSELSDGFFIAILRKTA